MTENNETSENSSESLNDAIGLIDENNSMQNDWLNNLSNDMKNHKSLVKFKNIDGLAKSYLELEKGLEKRIALPNDDANDEEWQKVYKKLGYTKDENYISDDKKTQLLATNLVDEKTLKTYENLFHQAHLTKRQSEKILNQILENNKNINDSVIDEQRQAREANTAKFYETYNQNSTEKLNILKSTMAQYGSSELVNLIETSQYSPVLIDLLLKLGEKTKSDSLVYGKLEKLPTANKEEAKKEIKRLESNQEFMIQYEDKRNPKYKEAMQKMQSLYDLAFNN